MFFKKIILNAVLKQVNYYFFIIKKQKQVCARLSYLVQM